MEKRSQSLDSSLVAGAGFHSQGPPPRPEQGGRLDGWAGGEVQDAGLEFQETLVALFQLMVLVVLESGDVGGQELRGEEKSGSTRVPLVYSCSEKKAVDFGNFSVCCLHHLELQEGKETCATFHSLRLLLHYGRREETRAMFMLALLISV